MFNISKMMASKSMLQPNRLTLLCIIIQIVLYLRQYWFRLNYKIILFTITETMLVFNTCWYIFIFWYFCYIVLYFCQYTQASLPCYPFECESQYGLL